MILQDIMSQSVDKRAALLGLSNGERVYSVAPNMFLDNGDQFIENPTTIRHTSAEKIADALRKNGFNGVRVVPAAFTLEGEPIEPNLSTVVFTRAPEPQT